MTDKRKPGRPRVSDTEKTQPYTISLTPSEVATIRKMGDGNLTAGIRKAIEMQSTNVTLKFVAQSGHVWEETIDADDVDSIVEQTVATHGDIERVEKLADPDDISGDTIWRFE